MGTKRLREWHGATLPAQVPLLAAAPKASESLRQEDKGRLRASVKTTRLAVTKPDPNLAGPSASFLLSLLSREFQVRKENTFFSRKIPHDPMGDKWRI